MARRRKAEPSETLGRALELLQTVPAPPRADRPYPGTILPGDAPRSATPAARWGSTVRSLGCVICRRFVPIPGLPELHHVAEGSGLRSDFAVVPLCAEHHRGATGLHGLSPDVFVVRYRVPGESEFGLLIWVAEDIARLRLR